MKNGLLIIFCCILSSLISLKIYDHYKQDRIIQEDKTNYSKLVSDKELILSKDLKRLFTSSSPTNFISAASQSLPAVTSIRTITAGTGSAAPTRQTNSTGSGVVISNDGVIVTNYHVIENYEEIIVMLDDKREYKAKVLGTDSNTDLAILKIEAENLPFLVLGNSDSLRIGEWVLAIGNPFMLNSTVTAGIVSAKARRINILESRMGIESFIQTDAAVNPGNSGGALVNTNGELLGINTAILSTTGKYEGFSFAIPSNLVSKVVYDIRQYGAVQRGWLGITISNIDDQKAEALRLAEVKGILVDNVSNNSAAADAGLANADVIIGVNGVATNTSPEFLEQIARYRPGDEVELTLIRNSKEITATAILRNQLNTTDFIAVRKDKDLTDLGFELRDMDSNEKSRLSKEGVVVVTIKESSKIDQTNMDPGFIITSINDVQVGNVDELLAELNKTSGRVYLEGYYENYPGKYPYTFYK